MRQVALVLVMLASLTLFSACALSDSMHDLGESLGRMLAGETVSMANDGTFPDYLVGEWYWAGTPYYVFNADGTGLMTNSDIEWTVVDGMLLICVTPRMCLGYCTAPSRWNYNLQGDTLTLYGNVFTFNYQRMR